MICKECCQSISSVVDCCIEISGAKCSGEVRKQFSNSPNGLETKILHQFSAPNPDEPQPQVIFNAAFDIRVSSAASHVTG